MERLPDGRAVWEAAFAALARHPGVLGVGIVTREDLMGAMSGVGAAFVVAGGETRTESVRRGLAAVPEGTEIVLVHDAARPWVTAEVIDRVIAGARAAGACVPGVAVTDTVRDVEVGTLDRGRLRAVQTPQGFTIGILREAYAEGEEGTDDASLVERLGYSVTVVEGDAANRKVTFRGDLEGQMMMETRTGLGYDVHRFSEEVNRPLWLGGVLFEGEGPGLEGHSDADALLHAVVDAVLGAASLGDIGEHFSNKDPRWKDKASVFFVEHARDLVREQGWRILNADVSVIAERPRILPRRDAIRRVIADALGLEIDRVSVKATTNEGLGAIGRGEGVSAFAVATLVRPFGG